MNRIYNPIHETLLQNNILFVIQGCQHCRKLKEFIHEFNARLPTKEMIELIDCTLYHDYGIITDNRIPIYIKYYKGAYPSLFIKSQFISGVSSKEEIIAWLKGRFYNIFEIDIDMSTENGSIIFEKKCEYLKKGKFKRRIECVG